jgi:NAD(P)-dependent dehydrogenase (short-subunit alcohol dehydrogenase family)
MGRGGRAEEVAEAILWLASEQASYTSGALLDVSGGR